MPAHVGIVTGGSVARWASVAGEFGVESATDLPGPAAPVDYALIPFIVFANRIARPMPPNRHTVVGCIRNEADFAAAVDALAEAGIDMIVWWSFALGEPHPAAEQSVRRAVDRDVIFAYPCFSGPYVDAPRITRVAAVGVRSPDIVVCPAPPNYPLRTPKVVSWGGWDEFRMAWRAAGIADGLRDDDPNMSPHALAVWSVAAFFGLALNVLGRAGVGPQQLRSVCIPVTVVPADMQPALGLFEPRFLLRFRR